MTRQGLPPPVCEVGAGPTSPCGSAFCGHRVCGFWLVFISQRVSRAGWAGGERLPNTRSHPLAPNRGAGGLPPDGELKWKVRPQDTLVGWEARIPGASVFEGGRGLPHRREGSRGLGSEGRPPGGPAPGGLVAPRLGPLRPAPRAGGLCPLPPQTRADSPRPPTGPVGARAPPPPPCRPADQGLKGRPAPRPLRPAPPRPDGRPAGQGSGDRTPPPAPRRRAPAPPRAASGVEAPFPPRGRPRGQARPRHPRRQVESPAL